MTDSRTDEQLSWVRCAATVAATSLIVIAIFLTISIGAALTDRSRYIGVIEHAVSSGAIRDSFHWPFGVHEQEFIYQENDCLILSFLVFPRKDGLLRRSLSPLMPSNPDWSPGGPPDYPPYQQCRNLKDALTASHAGSTIPSQLYHRYLHGDWVLSELLLSVMPLIAASILMFAVVVGLLCLLCMLAARNALRGAGGRDLAYATMASMLLLFFAVPAYDFSFSYAPEDAVNAAFLLYFYRHPPSAMAEGRFLIVATLFGALTAIFEFLTGGIPGGLVVLLAALVFDAWPDGRILLRRAVQGVAAFSSAILFCFAIKFALVAALWGPEEIANAVQVVSGHLGSGDWSVSAQNAARLARYGVTAEAIHSSRLFTTLYALFKMVYFSSSIGWGSLILGVVLTVVAPIFLAGLHLARMRHQPRPIRLQSGLILLAASISLLWICAFVQHTIAHAHIMFRIMIWPTAVLLAAAMSARSGRGVTQMAEPAKASSAAVE